MDGSTLRVHSDADTLGESLCNIVLLHIGSATMMTTILGVDVGLREVGSNVADIDYDNEVGFFILSVL